MTQIPTLTRTDIYPLADATGIELRASTGPRAGALWLTGARRWTIRGLPYGLALTSELKAVDSYLNPMEAYTTGVLLAMEGGDLRFLLLLDHATKVLTLFVLDASQLEKGSVFASPWSRAFTYGRIEKAVRGWYTTSIHGLTTGTNSWTAVAGARSRIRDYCRLRKAKVLSYEVEEALDALAAGEAFDAVVQRCLAGRAVRGKVRAEDAAPPAAVEVEGEDAGPRRPAVLSAEDILGARRSGKPLT